MNADDASGQASAPAMQVDYTSDAALVDEEIAVLDDLKTNVMRGWLEVGRDASNRLVFRITAEGRAKVEGMGKE